MTLRIAALYRTPTGLRLLLADAPPGAASLRLAGLRTLLSAARPAAGGVRLLAVAEGPVQSLGVLRAEAEGADGRVLPPLTLADPSPGAPPAAAFHGEAALGFALASAAAEEPALRPLLLPPPLGLLDAWFGALPALPGEALVAPDGSLGVWLPGAAAAELLALVPAGEGALLPRRLRGPPPRATPGGLLCLASPPMRPLAPPPAAVIGGAAGRCGRLRLRHVPAAGLAEALAVLSAGAASRDEAAALRVLAAAERAGRLAPLAACLGQPPDPGAPEVLLLAGLADPFLRRLLVLAEPALARRFAALLLVGADAAEAGRWLRPRTALAIGVATTLAETARRGAYARSALVPAGPTSLAAALAPEAEARPFPPALSGRALPALAALAAGEDTAAVLHLAGEGPAPWAA